MKNRISRFFTAALLPAVLMAAGCTEKEQTAAPEKLASPIVSVESATQTSVTLVWEAVGGADGYTYVVGTSDAVSTAATTVTIDGLSPDTEYSIRVKAVYRADNAYDSDWTAIVARTEGRPETVLDIETVLALPTEVTVKVTPDDPQASWYIGYMTENVWKSDYADADGNLDVSRLDELGQSFEENVVANVQDLLHTGTAEVTFDYYIEPGTTVVVYAFAVDYSTGKVLSGTYHETVDTPEMTLSDAKVTVTMEQGAKPDRDINVTYTPDAAIASYYTTFAYTSNINAALGFTLAEGTSADATEEQKARLQEFALEVISEGTRRTGNAEEHRIVDPGDSYTVCCAGYDTDGGLFFSYGQASSAARQKPERSDSPLFDMLKGSQWSGTQTLMSSTGLQTVTNFSAEIIDKAWSMDYTEYNELALMLYAYGGIDETTIDEMDLYALSERDKLKQYGPKFILDIDGENITIDITEYQTPVFEPIGPVYLKAYNYRTYEISDESVLKVTLSDDGRTMTISSSVPGYYPNLMLYSSDWVAYLCAVNDMVLTRTN